MSETINPGEKVFTQDEVNKIVSDRLAQERKKWGDSDPATLRAELDRYRAEAAQAALNERMSAVLAGREFLNEYTRRGVLADFEAAVNDPENMGRGDAELFSQIVKDREGIFKSAHPPVNMGGFKDLDGGADMIAEAFKPKI